MKVPAIDPAWAVAEFGDQAGADREVPKATGEPTQDEWILAWLQEGRLVADLESGLVYSPKSNTPQKPLGSPNAKGYLRTALHIGKNRGRSVLIHRVVCIAAHGLPQGDAVYVNHKNGVKADNRACNLEWVTHTANMSHAASAGLFDGVGRKDGIRDTLGRFARKGDAGWLERRCAKLTEGDVAAIRELDGQHSAKIVAERFGVSDATIRSIWKGVRWRADAGRTLDGREWNELPEVRS